MKRPFIVLLFCLWFGTTAVAQQAPADEAPTKADIEKYYEVMHVRELMKSMMEAMTKQMRQVMREEIKKRLPDAGPEVVEKTESHMDNLLNGINLEDLLQAMTPVYQKHLTKTDLDALTAFYSSPVGQRVLKEMPAMTAEAMQASTGLMRKQMDMAMQKTQELVAAIEKDANAKAKNKAN